ncbi:MAG: OprO/OprP family phosphate-selective porin, partial [Flavihumibacter sp.]|nr:OprO/OprP family phosphate-selective porin [Flavihumibacter sp.]
MPLFYRLFGLILFGLTVFLNVSGQDSVTTVSVTKRKWFETFTIRGYVQTRYNRLLETNPNLQCEQCDRSWGGNGGFFLRRVRVIIQGNISDRVSIYIQPDFASSAGGGLNYGQVRDAYFDLAFDAKKTWRIRVGQSKIPYGFEGMQSSSNRLPLDRSDGINSSFVNERDLGAFLYWAPAEKRELLNRLTEDGLKGSGDYGVAGFGVFNGQSANRPDQNRQVHVVGRFSW